MPARGALSVGMPYPVAVATAVIVPRDCSILGLWMPTSGSVTIYDAVSTSGLPSPIMPATALPIGWNPFPCDTVKGVVITATVACVLIAV